MELKIFRRKQYNGDASGKLNKQNALVKLWTRKPKAESKNQEEVESVGGAFCSIIPRSDQPRLHSNRSSNSDTTWKTCDSLSYHNHSPLLVVVPSRSSASNKKVGDEATELGMVLARSRKLPGPSYFSNNIILVNQERCKQNTPPLFRNLELDTIARKQAEAMANARNVGHSDLSTLRFKLSGPCRRIGENVAVGKSIKEIHKGMVNSANKADKNNISDRRYTCMGVGTAKGDDGKLYMCQIFKG